MANPVCLSPLKFYDDIAKQSHRKTYAHGHISPLLTKIHWLPPFQFIIPSWLYTAGGTISVVYLYDAKTDKKIGGNRIAEFNNTGFGIYTYLGYTLCINKSSAEIFTDVPEGLYYLKLASANDTWAYYSEVFCFTEVTQGLIEIEYWNETGDFNIKNGIIAFADNFHFKLLLKSELGKPEYSFEEESTKRLGYVFIESQVSKKVYKFNTIIPEFICDAMRIIRLCDNKLIRSLDEEYDAMSFEMEAEWQTQGDLASVTCEFETDNVVVNFGGFIPDKLGGDFNNDHNTDFDNQ